MASLKLNTASGGSVTLSPTDTASNFTVSLPSSNATILTTAALGVSVQAYDANALSSSDIGVSVQAYDSTILKSADIGSTVQAYDADLTTWGGKTAPSGTVVGTTDSQTLTNKTFENCTFTNGYTEESVTANTSTAYTIDLANGTIQILTLTGSCTYTFPTPAAGKSFTLFQKQDATGSRTVTWDSNIKWPASTAPTITSTASKMDIFSFVSDGTYWYGRTIGQNYL